MKNIFVNKNFQIRSGWKIALTLIIALAATVLITFFTGIIFVIIISASKGFNRESLANLSSNNNLMLISNLEQCFCMIFSVVLFWKLLDKKPIRNMGLINIKKGSRDLIIGLIFGAVSMTFVFVFLLNTSNITLTNPLTNPNFTLSMFTEMILFIFVGINEEMFARGYCMSVLNQTGNKWVVILVSSAIFALMHSGNPHMGWLSYLNLFLVGLLFAYMFVKSKNLWLSIGYHITWNYFEGTVFGFQVSGLNEASMYSVKNIGSNIVTGGQFGPEAGLVVTLVVFLGFIYLWKFYNPSDSITRI